MRVRLTGITKRFGPLKAVDNVSLAIDEGEFFTLLGPSGCGKTTLLRTIAGFYYPDAGEIRFGERVINEIPPNKRETGMVFQNYALFPHLSVFDNIAYGLRARKVPRREIDARVGAILESVQLDGLEDRPPGKLSGGQQQRVALARALVISPQILLMDEPLSNLDAKLRVNMREEIRRIQKRLGITTIYVTHDQEEAMAVSDRIAILNRGRLEQVGSPAEVYFGRKAGLPQNSWGTAISSSSTLRGMMRPAPRSPQRQTGGGFRYGERGRPAGGSYVSVRPEWIRVVGAAQAGGRTSCRGPS